MQFLYNAKCVRMLAMLAVAISCAASWASAQTPRRAPTRINTSSIRTDGGGTLLQALRRGESGRSYSGGFLHMYPGHYRARAQEEGGTGFVQFQQQPDAELLPPLPMDNGNGTANGNANNGTGAGNMVIEPEIVIGVQDPVPGVDQPVFVETHGNNSNTSNYGPNYNVDTSLGVPSGGYLGGGCDSCGSGGCSSCQKGGKGFFGKHGKGHGGKGYGGKGGKGRLGYGFEDWNWFCLCVPLPPDDNLTFNFGAHGFKGPLNGALDGSFGFQEGFNLGAAVPWCTLGIGWQIGLQGVHSNYPGQGIASGNDRDQLFFTWGFFRRVDYGLQGGFVVDHLNDNYIVDLNLRQWRGEVSWVTQCHGEFGVLFNLSDNAEAENFNFAIGGTTYNANITAEGTDLAAFFYRKHFGCCGESWGRIFVGATEDRGSLSSLLALNGTPQTINGVNTQASFVLGTEMHVNLSNCWSLETGFTWLTGGTDDRRGAFEDSWNVGFNLVWYPNGQTCGSHRGYYRPLFNVADNGSFLTHIRGNNVQVSAQ